MYVCHLLRLHRLVQREHNGFGELFLQTKVKYFDGPGMANHLLVIFDRLARNGQPFLQNKVDVSEL